MLSLIPIKYHRKIERGYSIIELINAMLLATIIIQSVMMSYNWIHKLYYQHLLSIQFTQRLAAIMVLISTDIQSAGVFGNFNLHYLSQEALNKTYPGYQLCSLDHFLAGAGIYSTHNSLMIISGSNVSNYKGNLVNENLNNDCNICPSCAICNKDNTLTFNNSTFTNNNYNPDSAVTIFTSNNRFYLCSQEEINARYSDQHLLNFNLATCHHTGISIESYNILQDSNSDKFVQPTVPNLASFAAMNFSIKEYYIATINGRSGLYYRDLNPSCTGFSTPVLIAPEVTAIETTYNTLNTEGLVANISTLNPLQRNRILGVNVIITALNPSPLPGKRKNSTIKVSFYSGF